ncbi:MAG TPA: hypothetical protein VNK95_02530 [Caldilineaceae bacterium]|nr:hypothetical protein [Caldilineaceae bacterium]
MTKSGRFAAIGLTLAITLLVIGWAESFPVSLTSASGRNLEQISLLFWIGLFLAFPLVFIVGLGASPSVRAFCCIIFIFLFTTPKLLYVQTGSDTETFVGLLDLLNGARLMRYGDQMYSQWPVLTMWGRLIQLYCECDPTIAYWFFWAVQIVLFGLAGFLLFSREPARDPADLLGLYLWISVLFWFWDWQVSAYNVALALVFVIFSLLPHERLPYQILVVLLFTVVAFGHGFVPVWVLTVVPLIMLMEWTGLGNRWLQQVRQGVSRREAWRALRFGRPLRWLGLFLVLATIQYLVMTLHSSRLIHRIILTLQDYYTSILTEQLSGNTVSRYVSMAVVPPSDPLDVVTKQLAWLDLGLNLLLISAAFIVLIWRRRFIIFDWAIFLAVFVTGGGHYIVGNFLPILGPRALNIMSILPVRGLPALLQHRWLRTPALVIFFLAVAIYPVNLLRMQMRHTQYNTIESINAVRFLVPQLEEQVQFGEQEIKVLVDQPQFHYLRVTLPSLTLATLEYREPQPTFLDFDYVLASPTIAAALDIRHWPTLDDVLVQQGLRYHRIYDAGEHIWYRRAPQENVANRTGNKDKEAKHNDDKAAEKPPLRGLAWLFRMEGE